MMRTLCGPALLCGLGLAATAVTGGCGGPPPTGAQVVEDAKAKEAAQSRADKMKAFLSQKAQQPKKGQSKR
jgi:hypothetical protein